MKKVRILLLTAAATLCSYPFAAQAQQDDEEFVEEDDEEFVEEDDEELPEEADDDLDDDDLDAETGLGDICKIDPDACPSIDFEKEAARQIREPLYAVQQVFVMRRRRIELQPYYALTLNDQFVSHPGPGLALNYWITNALAVGVNGNYHAPFNSDSEFNFQARRAARIGVPLTEYEWSAALNFTYSPIMGKFAALRDFIFQYDAYVVGGVGLLSSRPIAVIDPNNRFFEFEPRLAFNVGIGFHIFFNRWFAATLEVRDYIFNDAIENPVTVQNFETDPDTWLFEQNSLTNNVQAQVGFSIFFPFTFDYRLPK